MIFIFFFKGADRGQFFKTIVKRMLMRDTGLESHGGASEGYQKEWLQWRTRDDLAGTIYVPVFITLTWCSRSLHLVVYAYFIIKVTLNVRLLFPWSLTLLHLSLKYNTKNTFVCVKRCYNVTLRVRSVDAERHLLHTAVN